MALVSEVRHVNGSCMVLLSSDVYTLKPSQKVFPCITPQSRTRVGMFGHNLTLCTQERLCTGGEKKSFFHETQDPDRFCQLLPDPFLPLSRTESFQCATSWDSPRHVSASPARCPLGRGHESDQSAGLRMDEKTSLGAGI